MKKIEIVVVNSKRAKNIRMSIAAENTLKIVFPYRLQNKDKWLYFLLTKQKNWIEKNIKKQKQKAKERIYLPEEIKINGNIIKGEKMRAWARNRIVLAVNFYAKRLDFKYNRICITGAKTHWGSCTSRGNLSFSYKTALLPHHLFKYIILHELMHLKHMHHKGAFWYDLGFIYPQSEQAKDELKKYTLD